MEVAINERATTTAARVMTNRRRRIAGRERVMGWAGRGGGKLGFVWDLGSLAGLKGVARVIPLNFLGLRFFMWSARAQRQLAREERKFPSSPSTAKITKVGLQLHFGWAHAHPGNRISNL